MTIVDASTLVVPGQCICSSGDQRIAGNGTYLLGDYIFSSLTGYVEYKKENDETVVEVLRGFERTIVPNVGDIVTVKVTNIKRRFAKCAISCIGDRVLRETFRGIIRREDVTQKDKDKVEMYKSFRPGDVVLARVVSLGTMHSYNLSTAENELGVVLAQSEAGADMMITNWSEMICTKTFCKEPRKIARVVPQNFTASKFEKFQKEFDA